jgi:hypothetical protein
MNSNNPINPTSTRCALFVGLLGRYIAKDILKFNVEAWVNLNRS